MDCYGELRHNDATEESVLYIGGKSSKPRDYGESVRRRCRVTEREAWDAICPFCPGNESLCEQAIDELVENEEWIARCVPNRFPIFHHLGSGHEVCGKMEVIVADRRHNASLAQCDSDRAARVFEFWCRRYSVLLDLPDTKHVTMFINHGPRAGGSLQHAHYQVVALNFSPNSLKRLVQSQRSARHCLLCQQILSAQREDRIVFENDLVCAFTVVATRSGTVWIAPKSCRHRVSQSPQPEIRALGIALQKVAQMSYQAFDDPDFNVAFYNAPLDEDEEDDFSFHYYLVYVPHLLEDCSLATIQYGFAATNMTPELAALTLTQHQSA